MKTEPIKKIRFIESFASDRDTFVKHQEYEMPAADAESYINAGIAREVAPEPTPPPKNPIKREVMSAEVAK